jgi:hypothetical protein
VSTRIGLILNSDQHERLRDITTRFETTQSRLLQALVSVMGDNEIRNLLDRYAELEQLERDMRVAADRRLLGYIRGKTVDELRSLVAASRRAGA